jgi:hypothetical protein
MCRYVIIPRTYTDCVALQPHVIRVKHVLQCHAARSGSKMSDLIFYSRICENPVPITKDAGGDEDIELASGGCPVCLGSEGITEASDSDATVYTIIVSRLTLRAGPC